MPFLESIVRLDVKDVREVLESYKQEQEDGRDRAGDLPRAADAVPAIAAREERIRDRVLARREQVGAVTLGESRFTHSSS